MQLSNQNVKADYISLNIHDGATFARGTWRTLWRQWNQLSRLQRNVLSFAIFVGIIFVLFYILPERTITGKNYAHPAAVLYNEAQDYNALDNTKHAKDSEDLAVENAEPHVETEEAAGVGNIEEPEAQHPQQQPINVNHNEDQQIDQPPQPNPPKPSKFKGPQNSRQMAVVDAFKHSWRGYKTFAWGHDNVKPISGRFYDWFGLGLTIVDSLDTMYIMGLTQEFEEARTWVEKSLSFTSNRDVNLFEVTIRVLGGLLSTYHLTGDKLFLDKAIDLGDRMLPAFSSKSGVPMSDVNLKTKSAHSPKWGPDSSTSEVTSLQLEFRDLGRSSGQPRFEAAAAEVSEHVHKLEKYDGLVPIFINANTGMFTEYSTITLGARGDSYYEYLLKQWIQTGKTIDYLRDDYLLGIEGVKKHLLKRTAVDKLLFLAELVGVSRQVKPKMDHLTCYLGGTLALGAHHGLPSEHNDLAKELVKTCYQTYAVQPTFLAPEITYFNIGNSEDQQMDMYVKTNDAHNLLRPEMIESLFYLYYLANDTTSRKLYQDWGWSIFQAFEKHTKVDNGYTSIGNVRNAQNTRPRDMTESFWFAETLKYLYLLFDDERQDFDLYQWVFNSEGHPLPIHKV